MIEITVTKRTEITCDMAGTIGLEHFVCETIDLTHERQIHFAVGDTPADAIDVSHFRTYGYRRILPHERLDETPEEAARRLAEEYLKAVSP